MTVALCLHVNCDNGSWIARQTQRQERLRPRQQIVECDWLSSPEQTVSTNTDGSRISIQIARVSGGWPGRHFVMLTLGPRPTLPLVQLLNSRDVSVWNRQASSATLEPLRVTQRSIIKAMNKNK